MKKKYTGTSKLNRSNFGIQYRNNLDSAALAWRRHFRQDDRYFCSFAGRAFQIDAAPQAICDDAVYDVQAEASAALSAACGKERIECLSPDIQAHAATII
jgi:hypothetical protein